MRKLFTTLAMTLGLAMNCMAEAVQTIIVNGIQVSGKSIVTMTFEGDNAVLEYSDMTSEKAPIEQVCILLSYDATDVNGLRETMFTYNEIGRAHV